ncbi:MAG: hypothetical protein ICV59_09095 [Thermoleophilia bacterium]|nr:hypothetical protein [Thermoleophilia bacterium]
MRLAMSLMLVVLFAVCAGSALAHPFRSAERVVHADTPAALADVGPAAPWTVAEYDGVALSADALDTTTLPAIHAIYLHPSDAPSRFATYAAMFQRDAREASGVLKTLYDRGIRLDERVGADGVTRYVDITVVKSRYSKKELASSRQWSLVARELDRLKFRHPDKKYLVWLDAGSQYCGQSELYNDQTRGPSNVNERRTMSIAYRYYDAANAETGGFCGRRTVLHELTHAMGAVQYTAPNNDGGHVNDNANDVLGRFASTIPYSGGLLYDYGLDDYWDPRADPTSGSAATLAWWTVNLSRFVCPASGCESPNASPGY